MNVMPLGPVMIDVAGTQLDEVEKKRLSHPAVGGVILFSRNYENRGQLRQLVNEIKSLRSPALLVAVDQEGGRVQRFKQGFTELPAAATFGDAWQLDKHRAPMQAFESAYTMASELIDAGVDFSFAPVFDVCSVQSAVIGDRSFHSDPIAAIELLGAYIDGMHMAGMVAIAKHFPGHGGVGGDSHHCQPCDDRLRESIEAHDLMPYRELIDEIQGVMTAHVLYSKCDDQIATFSRFWLQDVLRTKLKFDGIVFSDDLAMQGAAEADDSNTRAIDERAQLALQAGCDMVLVCNRTDLVDELLAAWSGQADQRLSARLSRLRAGG